MMFYCKFYYKKTNPLHPNRYSFLFTSSSLVSSTNFETA